MAASLGRAASPKPENPLPLPLSPTAVSLSCATALSHLFCPQIYAELLAKVSQGTPLREAVCCQCSPRTLLSATCLLRGASCRERTETRSASQCTCGRILL